MRSIALTCAVGFATAAQSAVTRYNGTDWIGEGAFSESSNWQGGRDASSTAEARFNGQAGKNVRFDSLYSLTGYIWVGEWGNAASDYNLYISADGSTKNPVVFTANPGNGFDITGNLAIADGKNQTGALQVLTGAYGVGGILNLAEGNYSQGYLRVEQGALTVEGTAYAARCGWEAGATSKATLEVKDGALTINGCDTDQESAGLLVGVGKNTSASIVVDNGTLSVPNGGTMLYPNGEWDNSDDSITVNVCNSGTFSTGGALTLGRWGSESITVDVSSSGTLAAKSITRGGANGTAIINLNNGTLKALDDGTFIANGQNGIDIYVGDEGATIDTNNRSITIEAPISGEGTLTLVGGGTVTFLGTVACKIAAQNGTSYHVLGTYYWVGGAVGENPRSFFSKTAGKWSLTDGGDPIPDFVPGQGDTAVFTTSGVNLVADNVAANIRALADVGLYNHETKVDYVISGNLYVESGATLSIKGIKGHQLLATGAVTGSGTLRMYAETQSSTANLSGDMSKFTGNVNFVVGSNNTLATSKIGAAAAANGALAAWNIFLTENSIVPYRDSSRSGYTAFPLNNTTYRFGSLNAIVSYPDQAPANSTFVIGGRDNEDSSVLGRFQGAGNTIVWNADSAVNPNVTYTHGVVNCAGLTVTGGGIVKFTATDAIPAVFTLSNKGAYLAMGSDPALNAAVAKSVTTIAEGATVGLYGNDSGEASVDLSTATAFVGQTLYKRGAGTVYLTSLPANGGNDIEVLEGTLVLHRGAVVGNVTVSDNAQLLVDMTGAGDNEVVFTYGSLAGNVSYRNLASVGSLNVDDVANTWTYVVTGSARTFKWNGTEGASWAEPNNWLIVDGDSATTATEIPSAIDTAVIESDAAISVPATIAGNVVVSSGATLTITHGITFANSLTLDGNLAFDMTLDGVGASTPLVTVGGTGSSVSAANFILPATYEVTGTGTFTVTRVAGTYTWTGSVDNSWATSGNWKVGEMAVTEVPAQGDSVVFPANDAEGFQAWEVTLPGDVYADTVTLNANVVLSGARTLKAYVINGTAELKLNNAHLGCNGQDIAVNCPLNILPGTTDYIYLSGYNATLNGALYGSGKFVSDANNAQYRGVTFKGDVSKFYGEFEATKYNNRDATNMTEPAIGSENAVWRTNPNPGTGSKQQSTHFVIHDNETTYKFGAYVGGFWVGNISTPHIEIGNRDDVDSSFSMTSLGSRARYVITKVGDGSMTITNGRGDPQIGTLNANGGTSVIRTTPGTITFGGGAVRTPKYNAGTEEAPEEYYVDPSAVIQNSTGPIGFDSNGADFTWATEVPGSNRGGLTKYGAGTLTLAVNPLYDGLTTVMEGTLVLPTGSMFFTDSSRPVGALGNGTITGADGAALEIYKYAFPAGTVLYGDEKGADEAAKLANIIPGNLDFSNVTGVDVSAKTLVAGEPFVLAFFDGNITGLNKNNIELTVPERPEGVREDKWRWAVRVMTKTYPEVEGGEPVSKSYKCVCVAPEVIPFSIHLR